jgi:hypothetical protein
LPVASELSPPHAEVVARASAAVVASVARRISREPNITWYSLSMKALT